jgi:hypothetical protein
MSRAQVLSSDDRSGINIVPTRVSSDSTTTVASVKKKSPAAVYNLSVDGAAEYFANGVLVHNCDATRMLTVAFGPAVQNMTTAQKIQSIIPQGYHDSELQQRTDMSPDQKAMTSDLAMYFARKAIKGTLPKPRDQWGQPIGR